MVGWKEFKNPTNSRSSASVPRQKKMISSIYLSQRYGWTLPVASQLLRNLDSNLPINKHANVGATLDPMATPNNCKKSLESNTNRLQERTSMRRKAVGTIWSSRLSIAVLNVSIP